MFSLCTEAFCDHTATMGAGSCSVFVESEKNMSSQIRRDRRHHNSQKTWVPRDAPTHLAVVNEPSHPPVNTSGVSESLAAGVPASRHVYPQRHHKSYVRPPHNHHQRSNVPGPPPPNRQRRNNNAPGKTLPDNRQRVGPRTRPVTCVSGENSS